MLRFLSFSAIVFVVLAALTAAFNDPEKIVSVYNQARPIIVSGGGQKCLDELADRGIEFTKLDEMRDGICLVKDAVRINSFPSTSVLDGDLSMLE